MPMGNGVRCLELFSTEMLKREQLCGVIYVLFLNRAS